MRVRLLLLLQRHANDDALFLLQPCVFLAVKKPKPGFPYDVNCDFNKHVCGFKNGGAANWNWRTVNQTDGYVYTSFDTAGTTPGHFMSINFPPISGALESVRGELGCVRFYYLIETDGEAQIIVRSDNILRFTALGGGGRSVSI